MISYQKFRYCFSLALDGKMGRYPYAQWADFSKNNIKKGLPNFQKFQSNISMIYLCIYFTTDTD